MKFIKGWFSTFINLFFPSISAYRTYDRHIIDYIENNTLIEMNCKRILNLSLILILFPLLGLHDLYEKKRFAFFAVLVIACILTIYTIYVSIKIYKATKLPGNGILSRKQYFEKQYSYFWTVWTIGMLLIGFSRLNACMDGGYLYLTQLCLAFLPLITPKKFKKIAINTVFWATLLVANLFYYNDNEYFLPVIMFILTNMIFVYLVAFVIQRLNISINVMIAYVKMVGFLEQLTNVYNRRGFQFRVNELISENVEAGIIMLDIDFFKNYNDKFGHLEGDEILRKISVCLMNKLGIEKNIIVRFGGEEFAIVCLDSPLEETRKVAESIKEDIEALRIPSANHTVSEFLTVSIGIDQQMISKDVILDEIIDKADCALYYAKNNGRNQIAIASEVL